MFILLTWRSSYRRSREDAMFISLPPHFVSWKHEIELMLLFRSPLHAAWASFLLSFSCCLVINSQFISLSLSLAFNSTGKGVKGDSQKGEGERCWDAREKEREGGGEAGTDMKAARRCWWWKVKSRESIAMRDWQGGRDKRGKKGTEEQRVRANKPQKGLLGRRTSSVAPAVGREGGVSVYTHTSTKTHDR